MKKIIYVIQHTGLAGGVKVAYEHLNGLKKRGYKVAVFHIAGPNKPEWFETRFPFFQFPDYPALVDALEFEDAIKVATWWMTAYGVRQGIEKNEGFYLVQDIETSYSTNMDEVRAIFKTYELGLSIFTDSTWVQDQLQRMYQYKVPHVPPAIDHSVFYPRSEREPNRILYLDRSHFLKGREVFEAALSYAFKHNNSLTLTTFGAEPGHHYGDIPHEHILFPSDHKIAELYSSAACFVLTSHHEGFGIPLLEAMACGCPVVTTKADGNESFCADNFNCLMVNKGDSQAVGEAIVKIFEDENLRKTLIDNGLKTASKFDWDKSIDKLQKILGLATD